MPNANSSNPNTTVSRWRTWWLALMALTAVLLFARLGERALWSMEVRWGQIPREMRQTGDPFTPTINGKLYYDKPLGSYWLILAASWLNGDVDEWTARLPSAVSGLLAVVLLVHIARRLYGDRTALLAGLILATSFSFVGFGRTASADMETVAGVLAALAIYLGGGRRPASWRVLAFWLVMALTSLTKGLLGFALPLLIVGLHATFSGESQDGARPAIARFFHRNRWFFHRMTPIAMVLAVAVYFAPFLLAADHSILDRGLYMVFRENVQRFFNPVNHKGPIYLYAYVILGLFAPWSVLLPAALVHRPSDESTTARTFAIAFFWGTFIFFTLSASRRSYYLLPILPAASILVARLLSTQTPRLTAALGGIAIMAMGCFYLIAQPATESYRWQRPFAEQVRGAIGDDADGLALFHTRDLVYYLNSPRDLTEFESEQSMRDAVETGRVRWLLLSERDLSKLQLPMTVVVQAPIHAWDKGFDSGQRIVLARFEGGGR